MDLQFVRNDLPGPKAPMRQTPDLGTSLDHHALADKLILRTEHKSWSLLSRRESKPHLDSLPFPV